ncbi:MAG: C1 family peptidase [Bacteroidales bacterium]|nr:C1 family peptidase [Bacteroidales bacterium]
MKKFILSAALVLASCCIMDAAGPKIPEYTFTTELQLPVTSVKNQYRSGTCWAFSATSFVESEIIRINGIKDAEKYPDLSVMYTVSKSYQDRADKYVRLDGNLKFASGSEADDVLDIIRNYGIVPRREMPGLNYGTDKPVHGELDALAKAYVGVIVKNPNKSVSTAWKQGFKGIMDAYLGACPESFTVDGKEYTPASYRDALKFNPDDYISLTSFIHHPFYTWFAMEICDNWRFNRSYNVPLDELMAVLENALHNGYTVCWGTDVSTEYFTRDGIAMRVASDKAETAGSDAAHWTGDAGEDKPETDTLEEIEATEESRQAEFDNKTLTDDHGMHIYGIARNQFGKKFYIVKNSWGITGRYDGIWYASEAFVRAQTLEIMVHKDALTRELKTRLGIK